MPPSGKKRPAPKGGAEPVAKKKKPVVSYYEKADKENRRNSKHEEDDERKERTVDDDDHDGNAHDGAGDSEQAAGRGFAAAMSKVLGRTVSKSNPVLAKRHTAAEKLVAKQKEESKATKLKTREKKLARRAHMQLPDVTQQDYERQLRKVATKGVVSLFNTISKHQKAIATTAASEAAKLKETRQAAEEERLRPSATSHSFLDLLHQNIRPAGAQMAGGEDVGASGASTAAVASSSAGKKPAGAAFLSDNYLTSKKAVEATADDDDDEEGIPDDILDSDSE